jgi:molybdate transport repressor ModE-like protein
MKLSLMKENSRHYYKEVRLRQMRALVEISRGRSFAEAARKLGLSGPAVWQQVRALEREFDARLVSTSGREAVLTEDGELLLQLASPLLESFDGIRALFAERRGTLQRRLTLATTTALLTHELPHLVAKYRQKHPNVELSLLDRPSLESRALFERGQADIAIIGAEGNELASVRGSARKLTEFAFHLMVPDGHPLLSRRKLSLPDIAPYALILAGQGSAIHHRVPGVFARHGVSDPKIALTSTSLALTVSYVQMGFGIAIVPVLSSVAGRWKPSQNGHIHLRDVSSLFGHEQIVMLHRTDDQELVHVKAFREMVVKGMSET